MVASELENDNIDDNVITGDDDDGDDDDDNDAENMSGDDNDDDSSREDSVSTNNNTNSVTNPADATLPWMLLMVVADDDDDDDDDHDYYNDFRSDSGGVFEDDIGVGEGYVCMTLTKSYLPPEERYDTDITMVPLGVFRVDDEINFHQNFFNNQRGRPYINDDPIYNTQMFHPVILNLPRELKIAPSLMRHPTTVPLFSHY